VSAQNVLVLNNTVVQPENYGIDRTLDGQPILEDYPLSLDSMVWSAIDEIAIVLNQSNFFNSIAVYRKPIRTDSEWLFHTEISPEIQSEFYDMEDFDALLVIDRLLFSVKENVKKIHENPIPFELSALIDLEAESMITCSIYSYGKEKPLTTFSVSDSLHTKSTAFYIDSTLSLKMFPEYMLTKLSRFIGNQTAECLIPTWKTEKRVLFFNYDARMQEAHGYAVDRKWVKAESIWTAELGKKKKPVDKAKIAFNLAVANEVQDKIDPALTWAQKAKEFLKSAKLDSDFQAIELTTDRYISKLEQRIQNNRLLDLQWGKE
jgi:hypothetical protein